MIGRLQGKLIHKQPPLLLLDVAGVGYEVFAPMSTFYYLPDINQTVTLITHLIIREDAHLLYGFYHHHERELFRALIKVNGVGPKLALSILSSIEAKELVQCVQDNNVARLLHIPGVGRKIAERLLVETRDTLTRWSADFAVNLETGVNPEHREIEDAISALTALGYKPYEAQKAIKQVQDKGRSSQELIRYALQNMVPGGGL